MPQVEIRYFGISAFEITSEKGVKVLIDPCITGVGETEFSPVGLEAVPKVDLILVSHGAADHLGDTLEIAQRTNCQIIAAADVAMYLDKRGVAPERIKRTIWGMEYDFKGLRIKVLESHHHSYVQYGEWVMSYIPLGFILYTESGLGIFHPGDTSIFSDLNLFGELYRPQIGLLPVGLSLPMEGKYELNPREAAIVAKWMGLKMVVPTHWAKGSSDPQDFARYAREESPDTKVVIMQPGEKIVHKF